MRIIVTILLTLFSLDSFCQRMEVYSLASGSTAAWSTGDETYVMNYEVQDSVPGKSWVTLAEIPKGKSAYTYPLPTIAAWIRIRAVGVVDFYTNAIYVSSDYVAISFPVFHSTSLTWSANNEANVDYYLIQKTRNNVTTQVTKFTAKGNGKYTYRFNRTVYTYTYKITPIFKDGTSGTPVNFK